ncbi:hypothetical protein [Nocardiopsis synnemataformans]|uniref:hypothetical protein n=1 Tax=Nocardiopsis synnemataformans TaxID=61305 RepID=UPI003EBCFE29
MEEIEPTTAQVHDVMAALGTPHTDQHQTLGADFDQWQAEDTIRRVWPHIVVQARRDAIKEVAAAIEARADREGNMALAALIREGATIARGLDTA